MNRTIIISILLLFIGSVLPAVQLEKIDTVILTGGGGDDFLKVPAPFAVTEDGLYLIPDHKDGDVKVFDLRGKFVKRVGRKGQGPNEFISPRESDYLDGRYVVMDMGKRQYMLYARDKDSILKQTHLLRSMYMGNDVAMMKDGNILMAGYKPDKDGNHWELFTYNFNTKQYGHLVQAHTKFGYRSNKEYQKVRQDISVLDSSGFCDWWGEYAYLAWTGNLKIFKINLKTKHIQTFGKKTNNYRQPQATDRLKKAYKERNIFEYSEESGKFSKIMGLYTNKDYLLVMYELPRTKSEEINSRMLQFYTLDGVYINELQITKNSGCALYLSKDRDDGILYMIQWVPATDDSEESYQMTRFKMIK
jgi:hypothetical protein